MLVISRKSSWADRFRAYHIKLDDNVIGQISNGETVEFKIDKGAHQLRLQVDWCHSNIEYFDLIDDQISFSCGSNYSGKRLWLGVIHLLFPRQNEDYLWLRQDSSQHKLN